MLAGVSRIGRNDSNALVGYQRPEVRRHVKDIENYLANGNVLFPNAIILALTSGVVWRPWNGPEASDILGSGTLEIPVPGPGEAPRAWIVDGQQRALALARSPYPKFPVPVSAFVTDDTAVQRDQFLRVNNTRPLPRGLITELLPQLDAGLPERMEMRRIPSGLCEKLDRDPISPFYGLVRRASAAFGRRPNAVITDTALVAMIENSLNRPRGCLFPLQNVATGETNLVSAQQTLYAFWGAVRSVFPDAWGKSPRQSRLMHSVGIRAMGRLMDRAMSGVDPGDPEQLITVSIRLKRLQPVCNWTQGEWEGLGGLPWDHLQNIPQHIRLLSDFLIQTYFTDSGTV